MTALKKHSTLSEGKQFLIRSMLLCVVVFTLVLSSMAQALPPSLCTTSPLEADIGIIPDPLLNSSGPYLIKIYMHRIRLTGGTLGLTDEQVNLAFNRLVEDFQDHNISFVWDCHINNIDNTFTYYSDPCNLFYTGAIFDVVSHTDGIDIFLFGEEYQACGLANGLPSTAFFVTGNTGNVDVLPVVPLATSPVISHEMGHCLGLWHTHQGSVPFPELDFLCDELVNSSNCASCGDFVCDTPADPGMSFTVEHPDCEWSGSETDANLDPYDPDEKIIMSYSNPSCMEYFTDGQGERMRQMIAFSPVLQACLVEPDVTNLTIQTTTTWDGSTDPNGNRLLVEEVLTVSAGATLTITADMEVAFAPEARIIIEPDATLILEGTLTSMGCGLSWQGVEVWGDSEASQYVVSGVRAQGRLITRNGARIENAQTAVKLYGPNYTSQAGGQINSHGTIFSNNGTAVEIAPYHNYWPFGNSQQGQPRNYFGSFAACHFITDNQLPKDITFDAFLELVGVKGIQITGCDFSNTQTLPDCAAITDYGYGIHATDAGFTIQAECDSGTYPCISYRPSTFSGLGYGVRTATAVNNKPFIVRQAEFSNCYIGINSSATSFGTILFNDFRLGVLPDPCVNNAEQLGVFFETDISGFTLEENTFSGTTGSALTTVGIHCRHLGNFNNVIRRNTFSGLTYGNTAEGQNASNPLNQTDRGLHYLCNTITNISGADLAVVADESTNANRIRYAQGWEREALDGTFVYLAAGNLFSYGSGADLSNEGAEFKYHYDPAAPAQQPLVIVGSVITEVSAENTCLTTYCEPPCKTEEELALEKDRYFAALAARGTSEQQWQDMLGIGNILLAEQNRRAAAYYQRMMDESAYTIVHHLLYDTIAFDEDSLLLWQDRLDTSGREVIKALRASEDSDNDDELFGSQDKRTKLLQLFNKNSPYTLDREERDELDMLTSPSPDLVSTIARNTLGIYGRRYLPLYHLPQAATQGNGAWIGTAEAGQTPNIVVHPNPSSGRFHLRWEPSAFTADRTAHFLVYDLTGKLVHQQRISAEHNEQWIELTNVASGIYFYGVLLEGQSVANGKLIIQ